MAAIFDELKTLISETKFTKEECKLLFYDRKKSIFKWKNNLNGI